MLAGFAGDIHRYQDSTDTWIGMAQPISTTAKGYATTFLDRVLFVNGEVSKRYDGSVWTNEIAVKKAPLAKYIINAATFTRVYLGYLSYNINTFASRVWYTDLPKNNDITYGLEYGTDLVQTAGQSYVTSASAYFKTRNIKEGDPFIIQNGTNAGEYRVASIDSEFRITLTTVLNNTATGSSYWVGGNWFDVVTNDNDVLYGFAENSSRLLCFKRNSVHRYDGRTLKPIKGIPGTSSQDSILTKNEYTYYFNPDSGIWRTDSTTGQLVSRPVQDYIQGINPQFYSSITTWLVGETKEILRFFIGDVSNTDAGISISNCFLDFDTITESWTPGRFQFPITKAITFIESNAINWYLGSDQNAVYQSDIGDNDAGTAIDWFADSGWHFPAGARQEIEFTRMEIHTRDGRGMQVKYRLYGTPYDIDKQWRDLDDISDNVTEIELENRRDRDNIGRGIRVLLQESSTLRHPVVEKIDVFWKPSSMRSL